MNISEKKMSKINYLNSLLNKLEKEEQTKTKERRKEILKIKEDISVLEKEKH